MESGGGRLRGGTTAGPPSWSHTPEGLAGSATPRLTLGFPWQDSHLAKAHLQDPAILSYKYSSTLFSSETQVRRLQMVPLTDCSQEPRHMNVSEGSVKLEDDSGETPLEISHHCKQDSSTDRPPLTPVPSR